jgi:hypothetical protein
MFVVLAFFSLIALLVLQHEMNQHWSLHRPNSVKG